MSAGAPPQTPLGERTALQPNLTLRGLLLRGGRRRKREGKGKGKRRGGKGERKGLQRPPPPMRNPGYATVKVEYLTLPIAIVRCCK